MKRCLLFFILSLFIEKNMAQSSSLLADGTTDFIRRAQLTGEVGLQNSLLINSFSSNLRMIDSTMSYRNTSFKYKKINISFLPFNRTAQFNSEIPYGSNDGSMIPSKGMQWVLSGGVKLSLGNLTLNIKPEYITAQNLPFETFPTEHYPVFWKQYYRWLNTIDNPESFGTESYRKVLLGQTNLKYKFKKIELGVSNENLWWGPGRFNALIQSNNAAGFKHFTVNTVEPINTKLGAIEWQVIAGSLAPSNILPPDHYRYENGALLYKPKPTDARNIQGLIFSWQPKWTPHVFVGFTTVSYGYAGKTAATMGSLFSRYVLPKDNAELYFEFGRNDKSPTPINIANENNYPRAYVAGVRKLVPIQDRRKNRFIELAAEFTQLQLPTSDLTVQGKSWYTSELVQHGYTNEGQLIGASIGPGSNIQTIAIAFVQGFTKLGLKFDRLVHNNDFYYNAFTVTNDATRHWVDVSTTVIANYQYKRFLLSSNMAFSRSLNYQWYILEGQGYFKNGYDLFNFHTNISLAYRF